MPKDLTELIKMFTDIGLTLIPFLGALAFLFFALGVARFIRASSNEKERNDSKNMLFWGIVGLFILMTIWGIITFLRSEFGWGDTLGIPQIEI